MMRPNGPIEDRLRNSEYFFREGSNAKKQQTETENQTEWQTKNTHTTNIFAQAKAICLKF